MFLARTSRPTVMNRAPLGSMPGVICLNLAIDIFHYETHFLMTPYVLHDGRDILVKMPSVLSHSMPPLVGHPGLLRVAQPGDETLGRTAASPSIRQARPLRRLLPRGGHLQWQHWCQYPCRS